MNMYSAVNFGLYSGLNSVKKKHREDLLWKKLCQAYGYGPLLTLEENCYISDLLFMLSPGVSIPARRSPIITFFTVPLFPENLPI